MAVAARTTKPILSNVKAVDHDDALTLMGTDLEVGIRYELRGVKVGRAGWAILPVTHSLPTLAGNVVNMIAAGNTVVFNPHPGGARIAVEGVRRFNQAIFKATGLENLINIIEQPTLETAEQIFNNRGIRLLVVTGGPAVARAALASRTRAIVAGPGNPPVVVDETACLENAAASIVLGAVLVMCVQVAPALSQEPTQTSEDRDERSLQAATEGFGT